LLPYTTTLLYTHYIYIDIDIYMCTSLVPVHCSRLGEGERIRNRIFIIVSEGEPKANPSMRGVN